MRWPRLSSFTIIGVLLVGIGVYGLIQGSSFQYDTGVAQSGGEGYLYILAGVVMLVNSFFSLPPMPSDIKDDPREKKNVTPAGLTAKEKISGKIS